MKTILTTYETWRQTHNPWTNFYGNLDPTNQTDSEILLGIYDIIDKYYNPRILGVENPERFLALMTTKLKQIESNFFKSFMLDSNYDTLVDMLKNINQNTNTNSDSDINGTSSGSNDTKRTDNLSETHNQTRTDNLNEDVNTTRTDNLKSTKSDRTDTTNGSSNNSTTIGQREDSKSTTYGGSITRTMDYGTDNQTATTNYGKKSTQGGTTGTTGTSTDTSTGRTVSSDTPQSNVGNNIVGINAQVDWNYASGLQDSKSTSNGNTSQTVTHGLTDTLSGEDKVTTQRNAKTDTEATSDARTVSENGTTGKQNNQEDMTVENTYVEGSQSTTNTGTQTIEENKTNTGTQKTDSTVTNSGTQDTNTKTDKEFSQTSKCTKNIDNSGRTYNLATIRQQWRDLLHTTVTAYTYIFNELDSLFMSIWDIEDDCIFTIV